MGDGWENAWEKGLFSGSPVWGTNSIPWTLQAVQTTKTASDIIINGFGDFIFFSYQINKTNSIADVQLFHNEILSG
jgi:hypothetical protein